MFPVIRLLRGRIAAYNMHLRGIADDYGCYLVDLWSMRALKDVRPGARTGCTSPPRATSG